MIDRDGPDWAVSAFWAMAVLYVLGFLLLVALFAAGFVVGPAPQGAPPAVDFDDEPQAVIEDATDRLKFRDHTYERWITENASSANRTRKILARVHQEISQDRLRAKLWLNARASEQPVSPSDPALGLWIDEYGVTYARAKGGVGWARAPSDLRYNYGTAPPRPWSVYDSESANYAVLGNNETHYVVEVTDPERSAFEGIRSHTVRIVVAKRPDPHLSSYTARTVTDSGVDTYRVVFSNYGTAAAPRPGAAPSITIEAVVGRAIDGLDRLGFVGPRR